MRIWNGTVIPAKKKMRQKLPVRMRRRVSEYAAMEETTMSVAMTAAHIRKLLNIGAASLMPVKM